MDYTVSPISPIKPPKRPIYKRPLFYVLTTLASIFIGITLYFYPIYSSIVVNNNNKNSDKTAGILNSPNPNELSPTKDDNRLDVLIMGIHGDSQEEIDQEGGLLTDTMLMVSIDRRTGKTALISIPRDFSIDLYGVKGKINQSYERGLERKQGLELVRKIVSAVSGVYIDKVVVFDFNSFKTIVDELGGVDVTLAKPFSEPKQWGYPFDLPAGLNHLNGEQALYYARSRYSTSDFDRSRRQEELIFAIKNKAVELGYNNPIKLAGLMKSLQGHIQTDFQIWDINDLLKFFNSLSNKESVSRYVIDTTNFLYETKNANGEYILLPKSGDYTEIRNFFGSVLTKTN